VPEPFLGYNSRRWEERAPMADVFMREVQCESCGSTTRHRTAILERIIQLQSVLLYGETYINFACPECNALTRSLVVPGAKVFREVDLSKFPDDLELYVVSLLCAIDSCESRIQLLAPVKRAVREEELPMHAQTNWRNHNAACLNNHPPSYPFRVGGWMKAWPE
jgi:hypothetical protein